MVLELVGRKDWDEDAHPRDQAGRFAISDDLNSDPGLERAAHDFLTGDATHTVETIDATPAAPLKLTPEMHDAIAELASRGYASERAIGFDKDGNQIVDQVGKQSEVQFTNQQLEQMRGGLLIHSHPSYRPPSPADVLVASSWNMKGIISVHGDQAILVEPEMRNWGGEDGAHAYSAAYSAFGDAGHEAYEWATAKDVNTTPDTLMALQDQHTPEADALNKVIADSFIRHADKSVYLRAERIPVSDIGKKAWILFGRRAARGTATVTLPNWLPFASDAEHEAQIEKLRAEIARAQGTKDFDEDKHPRDAAGKFSEGDGGGDVGAGTDEAAMRVMDETPSMVFDELPKGASLQAPDGRYFGSNETGWTAAVHEELARKLGFDAWNGALSDAMERGFARVRTEGSANNLTISIEGNTMEIVRRVAERAGPKIDRATPVFYDTRKDHGRSTIGLLARGGSTEKLGSYGRAVAAGGGYDPEGPGGYASKAWRWLRALVGRRDFDEDKHPRDEHGRFAGDGGGGSSLEDGLPAGLKLDHSTEEASGVHIYVTTDPTNLKAAFAQDGRYIAADSWMGHGNIMRAVGVWPDDDSVIYDEAQRKMNDLGYTRVAYSDSNGVSLSGYPAQVKETAKDMLGKGMPPGTNVYIDHPVKKLSGYSADMSTSRQVTLAEAAGRKPGAVARARNDPSLYDPEAPGGYANKSWLGRLIGRKYNDSHDERGRFATGDGGAISGGGAGRLLSTLRAHGGFTYSTLFKSSPKTGKVLSIHPKREQVISGRKVTVEDLDRYVAKNKDLLSNPRNYIGGWKDAGQVYLDVSAIVSTHAEAVALGNEYHQKAYFDLDTGKEVRLEAGKERRWWRSLRDATRGRDTGRKAAVPRLPQWRGRVRSEAGQKAVDRLQFQNRVRSLLHDRQFWDDIRRRATAAALPIFTELYMGGVEAALRTAHHVGLKDFDEDQHPRDQAGRFAGEGGGDGWASSPHGVRAAALRSDNYRHFTRDIPEHESFLLPDGQFYSNNERGGFAHDALARELGYEDTTEIIPHDANYTGDPHRYNDPESNAINDGLVRIEMTSGPIQGGASGVLSIESKTIDGALRVLDSKISVDPKKATVYVDVRGEGKTNSLHEEYHSISSAQSDLEIWAERNGSPSNLGVAGRARRDEGMYDPEAPGGYASKGTKDDLPPPLSSFDQQIAQQVAIDRARLVNEWWSSMETTIRKQMEALLGPPAASPAELAALDILGELPIDLDLGTVIDGIGALFGPERAQRIAVTETTRVMGQAAQATYNLLGAQNWEWRTAEDDRVCQECEDGRDNGPYAIDEPFEPAHVRCRCWPVPLVGTKDFDEDKHPRDQAGKFAVTEIDTPFTDDAERAAGREYAHGYYQQYVPPEGASYFIDSPFVSKYAAPDDAAAKLIPVETAWVGKVAEDPAMQQAMLERNYPEGAAHLSGDPELGAAVIQKNAIEDSIEYAQSKRDSWSISVNGAEMTAFQQVVAETFGITDAHDPRDDGSPTSAMIDEKIAEEKKDNGKVDAVLAKDIYNQTQASLKEAGITEVTLYRGMSWTMGTSDFINEKFPEAASAGNVPEWTKDVVKGDRLDITSAGMNPLTSWSSSSLKADGFGKNRQYGMVIEARIPADKIFSTPQTGFGSPREHEWVVLSHDNDTAKVVQAGTLDYQTGEWMTPEQTAARDASVRAVHDAMQKTHDENLAKIEAHSPKVQELMLAHLAAAKAKKLVVLDDAANANWLRQPIPIVGRRDWNEDDHPRDHGRFTDKNGDTGSTGEIPRGPFQHVETATEALTLLAQGKYVELPPGQVGTLLEKMADVARDAEAKGEKAPKYDLCNVSVPDTNIFCEGNKGISRADMPQIDNKQAFKDYLGKQGVTFTDVNVPAEQLKATQREIDGVTVGSMMEEARTGAFDPRSDRIFVSSDNFVLDGHHRWAATVGIEYDEHKPAIELQATRVNLPISVLLGVANKFDSETGQQKRGIGQDTMTPEQFAKLAKKEFGLVLVGRKFNDAHDEHGKFATSDSSGTVITRNGINVTPAQRGAVMEYSSVAGYGINRFARSGKDADVEGLADNLSVQYAKEIIANIDKAIAANTTKEPMTLYRGISGKTGERIAASKIGTRITDRGFVSTSQEQGIATIFGNADEKGIVVAQINVPAGYHALDVASTLGADSIHPKEKEFILPRNTTFEVTAVHRDQEMRSSDTMTGKPKVRGTLIEMEPVEK